MEHERVSHADDERSESSRSNDPVAWFHVMCSTYAKWIRAAERGFRDRGHRIHSSGDYRRPPPEAEHAGLRRWVREHLRDEPVRLAPALRQRVGEAFVRALREREITVLIVAVGAEHAHLLARFPREQVRSFVGHAKRRSSHAIRDVLPGAVWAKGCGVRVIRTPAHQRATFQYIADHRAEGAWVWCFRDPPPGEIERDDSLRSSSA